MTVDKLDLDSILDIKVLKGKEAIEKYGTRGINGVIIITTKKVNKKVRS